MKILGLSGPGHDLAFCLLDKGQIVTAIEEERISREKHGLGFRSKIGRGMQYCLDSMNYKIENLELIITNDLTEYGFLEMLFRNKIQQVKIINHHLAHAASAYYLSGYDECAVLIIDGAGSTEGPTGGREVISLGHASGGNIDLDKKFYGDTWNLSNYIDMNVGKRDDILTDSLGDFYKLFTFLCGFKFLEEGKLMGLAPYGKDTYVKEISKYIAVDKDKIEIRFNNKDFFNFYSELVANKNEAELFCIRADLGYAAQYLLEECVFIILDWLYERTKCTNVCFSGGVALNSVLNGKIISRTPFKKVFIQPAANDAGTAIGSALYGYHVILGNKYIPRTTMKLAYMGRLYEEDDIMSAIKKYDRDICWQKNDYSEIVRIAAVMISEGKIIGWFQGRSEIGPRALGNRSILADPRKKDMKDILNHRVKFREAFRPFAPSVLQEYAKEYFEMEQDESPFMLMVYKIKDNVLKDIPAVTHVDGTARVQTVTKQNGIYYDLITAFYDITGIPLVLNTSFNIKGQPMVETPEDAIQSFLDADMDALFIGEYIIKKLGKIYDED